MPDVVPGLCDLPVATCGELTTTGPTLAAVAAATFEPPGGIPPPPPALLISSDNFPALKKFGFDSEDYRGTMVLFPVVALPPATKLLPNCTPPVL